MNLETNIVTVAKNQTEVFNFLSNVKNYEQLMPENIDKFEAINDQFIFALKGMPEITLQLQETHPNDKVVLGSTSNKFPFTLTGTIKEDTSNSSQKGDNCTVQLVFDGKFNPMMSMMIKNPIQKFINTLIENIGKI
ncbi:MAG: orotate phosphoribosyltransferase [Flavobacteriales bacterium]|nr:MAG: orotate phosphoribosyltransferase [Flavobacteriales bacterium]